MKLTMLPAGEGDALWLRWGPDHDRRQLLVDLGVNATGKALLQRLATLPQGERHFDLLVVTHVDTDHIYGVLSALVDAEPLEGLTFDDVWFNGYTHLSGMAVAPFSPPHTGDAMAALKADANRHFFGTDKEAYGGKQGEQLSIWLRTQPWNRAFGGMPVSRNPGEAGPTIELAHGLRLTVLGPTPQRLQALQPKWKKEVSDALRKGALDPTDVAPGLVPPGLEPMGKKKPKEPTLHSPQELKSLADKLSVGDASTPNGSSIALLVEYGTIKLVLAGDAFPEDLAEAFDVIAPGSPLTLTAFKLPHHGSQNNVSKALVQAVRCKHWLVSTNGVKHYHPDAEAMARVVHYAKPSDPVLYFNEPSAYNQWWARAEWTEEFAYKAVYGSKNNGLTLDFKPNGEVVAESQLQ